MECWTTMNLSFMQEMGKKDGEGMRALSACALTKAAVSGQASYRMTLPP